MLNLEKLISKPLLCLVNGKNLGTLCGVYFEENFTRVKDFIFFNDLDNPDSERKFCITFENVTIGEDALLINDESCIFADVALEESPINFDVFDYQGKYYGKIRDVEISEKGETVNIIAEKLTFNLEILLNYSKGTLIICDNASMRKSLRRAKTMLSKKAETENIQTPSAPASSTISNFGYLIGRRVMADIISRDEKLVKKGTLVNEKILNLCKSSGKLIELAKLSK